MPQILIPIALALLLVGGCCEKQEVTTEDVRIAYNQHAMEVFFDTLTPCPPCPDTARLWMRVDSTRFLDHGTEIHFSSPDTVYRMPPGRWVPVFRSSIGNGFYFGGSCPDSVFILKE